MIKTKLAEDALAIFKEALRAADAYEAVRRNVSVRGRQLRAGGSSFDLAQFDRVFYIAAGKAAIRMARAIEEIFGSRLDSGVAVTKHGHAGSHSLKGAVHEVAHPVPDEAVLVASDAVGTILRQLNARDLLIVAISGGSSAVLTSPAEGLQLADKQAATRLLLEAGADIFELNAVRKHLSAMKGGHLAALAYPATVVGLLLSDVIGDPLDVIGSGPTAPDPTTYSDAIAVLRKFGLERRVPKTVMTHLRRGAAGRIPETPKLGALFFQNVTNLVVGSNRLALAAAQGKARALGYRTLILSSSFQGEAREVAKLHGEILKEVDGSGNPVARPACLLSGGETTVTVTGGGKGGRNQEFALAAAIQIAGLQRVAILSAGTDGTDGPTDAAGAIVSGDTIARATSLGVDAAAYLKRHDSYEFFDRLGDLIKTGPTGTNVMDINVMLAG